MSAADDSSSRNDRVNLFTTNWFSLGWSHHVPATALAVLQPLVTHGPLSVDELERHLFPSPKAPDLGWNSTAWEPLDEYTDESLQELRAEFEDTPFAVGPDEPDTAEAVMAEEIRLRLERMDEVDRWSRELGVEPVRTLRDLLEFLLAAGVLTTTGAGDTALIRLNESAPLPGEVLTLSEEDRRSDDDQRWQRLHEPAAQAVIDLFVSDEAPTATLRTSLQRLAREVDLAVESVRAGVVHLLNDGDFTASADVERLLEHQVFELTVDWKKFRSSRITIVS